MPGMYGAAPLPEGTTASRAISIERESSVRTIEGDVIQIAAVVTPVFGGARNLRLPDVNLTDRLLDFVVIEALEPRHLLQLIERLQEMLEHVRSNADQPQAAADALHQDVPGLWRFKARSAHVVTPENVDVTLDGEIRARTPLDVYTVPDALRVLVPAAASMATSTAAQVATGDSSGA